MSQLARVLDWLDERSGYRALVRAALDEEIPGGPRLRYVFGSVLVFLLVNQLVTGLLLAMGYAPSVNDAWASVAYTQELAPLGWFIRGMHATGASAAIVVVVMHLLQVTWAGAYRRPRELTWWMGLCLLGLLLAFGLTGYLLPWDQKGYFATQVATNLIGATPLVGTALQSVVQGGAEYGNLTLTRFYALHVLALPILTVAVLGAHVALFRRHGVTPPASLDEATLAKRAGHFYPAQLAIDLGACALCALAVVAIVVRGHGVGIEAPADPASGYEARPEWYFLPLFQLLRKLPGSLEVIGALGAPALVGGLLFALPFLDRAGDRRASARRLPIALVGLIVCAAIGLGWNARVEDHADPSFARGREKAEREAERARLRFRAKVAQGPLSTDEKLALAEAVFDERCAECHVLHGRGEARAPSLDGWASRTWLDAFLKEPEGERFFGPTKLRGMKPVTIEGEDRSALIEWLWSQGGSDGADARRVEAGSQLYASLACDDCHERDGTSPGGGVPNLGGKATEAWIAAVIRDASAPQLFGKKNEMPRFADKLSDVEIDALVALLRRERVR